MMKTALLALTSLIALPFAGEVPRHIADHATPAQSRGAPPIRGAMRNFTLELPAVPAPAVSFQDPSGHDTGFEAFRGKVVLVNVWATWCGPCIHELPTLARLRQRHQGADFKLVELSEDRGGAPVVKNFFARHDFGLTSYLDPHGHIMDALNVHALPTTFLIDRDGNILGRLIGDTEWDGPDAEALIDWALTKKTLPVVEPISAQSSSRIDGLSGSSSVSTR
ncbi:MAG TPA: TlpA disulfide reductase family protein [Stellaceae bacterium]|nr:TlpA disulfide reductase family protein [Stellaceae bacterium]